jgi:hypothetical protein
MGGNLGYKRLKDLKQRTKSQNFNKPGKAEQNTNNLQHVHGWDVSEKKYKDYVNREFGIKFKTNDTNFYPDSRENSNLDTSHMTEEEIVTLNTQLYEDFYKNVPVRCENLRDKSKWRVEKNHCKNRRRDANMKLER